MIARPARANAVGVPFESRREVSSSSDWSSASRSASWVVANEGMEIGEEDLEAMVWGVGVVMW